MGRELLSFNEQKKAERQAKEHEERRHDHEMIEQVGKVLKQSADGS